MWSSSALRSPGTAESPSGHDPHPRGRSEVVGILEPTLTVPDSQAFMPLTVAQRLYMKDLPADIASQLVPAQTITHIVVYPPPGQDVEQLATKLEASLPKVTAVTAQGVRSVDRLDGQPAQRRSSSASA